MSTAQDHGSRASTNRAAASAAPQRRCACRGVAASKADVLTRCKLKGVSHSWRAGARRVLCARVPAEFDRTARRALPEGGWGRAFAWWTFMLDYWHRTAAPACMGGMYAAAGRASAAAAAPAARLAARRRHGRLHVCGEGMYAAGACMRRHAAAAWTAGAEAVRLCAAPPPDEESRSRRAAGSATFTTLDRERTLKQPRRREQGVWLIIENGLNYTGLEAAPEEKSGT